MNTWKCKKEASGTTRLKEFSRKRNDEFCSDNFIKIINGI